MKRTIITGLLGAALLTGCGSGAHPVATTTVEPSQGTSATSDPTAALKLGARAAVLANAKLSNFVLWSNTIPTWAEQSTTGPALQALRASAAGRRAQRVQVKGVQQHVDVVSLQIDPSYLTATATVRESGEVRPYRDGRLLGRPIRVNELAELELRRRGNGSQFQVWKVNPRS